MPDPIVLRDSAAELEITGRLDRIPVITPTHKLWVGLLAFFFVFDTIDLSIASYTAPAWRVHWGISVGEIGLVTSATFVGMFVGAILGGRLSDRVGRKKVIIGGVILMSIASLATAFAQNIETVMALRVITGLGLQAMMVTIIVYTTEMLPSAFRGRYVSIVFGIGIATVPVAALLSTLIVPLSEDSWRWMFVLGAVGASGAVLAARRLPESMRWLVSQGRVAEADAILSDLERQVREMGAESTSAPSVEPAVNVSASGKPALGRRLIVPTIVASIAMICVVLANYGLSSWIPTFLIDKGFTTSQALTYSTVLAVAAAIGAFTTYLYVDKWERKNIVAVLGISLFIFMLLFAFAGPTVLMLGLGLVCVAIINSIMSVMYTYVPEIFPTSFRGVGAGIASGASRLAGIGGSLLVPVLYAAGGFSAVYVYVAIVGLTLALVIGILGLKTTNRALA